MTVNRARRLVKQLRKTESKQDPVRYARAVVVSSQIGQTVVTLDGGATTVPAFNFVHTQSLTAGTAVRVLVRGSQVEVLGSYLVGTTFVPPPTPPPSNPPPPTAPIWTASSPPNPVFNTAYTYQFAATNAVFYTATGPGSPVGTSLTGVPDGMSLSSDGILSGTPTRALPYQFTATAWTADNASFTPTSVTLDVSSAPYHCSPGRSTTFWFFPNSGYTSTTWTMTPVQDAPSSMNDLSQVLHYYANTFFMNNNTSTGGFGYAGFQTNGLFGPSSIPEGKVINFSIWGATAANGGTGTLINPGNTESGGYQLMLPFNWTVGHPYVFVVAAGPTAPSGGNVWWGLHVTDNATGTTTYVGELQTPSTLGGLPITTFQECAFFAEDTHWYSSSGLESASPTIYTCSDFQTSAMSCTNVSMTGPTGTDSPTSASFSVTTSGEVFQENGETFAPITTSYNGVVTICCQIPLYMNSTNQNVQHNLGYWPSVPHNTVSGTLIY